MGKQLSKITIRLLSVSIVLTIVGVDHNVSDIEAALAVRTIMAEQQVGSMSRGAVLVNNFLFDYAVGNADSVCHIVLKSHSNHNQSQQKVNNLPFAIAAIGNKFDVFAPQGQKLSSCKLLCLPHFGGGNVAVRAGPTVA